MHISTVFVDKTGKLWEKARLQGVIYHKLSTGKRPFHHFTCKFSFLLFRVPIIWYNDVTITRYLCSRKDW